MDTRHEKTQLDEREAREVLRAALEFMRANNKALREEVKRRTERRPRSC